MPNHFIYHISYLPNGSEHIAHLRPNGDDFIDSRMEVSVRRRSKSGMVNGQWTMVNGQRSTVNGVTWLVSGHVRSRRHRVHRLSYPIGLSYRLRGGKAIQTMRSRASLLQRHRQRHLHLDAMHLDTSDMIHLIHLIHHTSDAWLNWILNAWTVSGGVVQCSCIIQYQVL